MQRLDLALVKRGLSESRARAQRAIEGGFVSVNGAVLRKPAMKVGDDDTIRVDDPNAQWVSRAALKLEPFLEPQNDRVALDLGASTGGFTQLLLARGARKVFAVDVGHDQMHPRLREDDRVILAEGLNVKALDAESFDDPDWPKFQVITSDLSFISLKKALPAAMHLARTGVEIYALIKPQFELDPSKIGKGGLVSDPKEANLVVRDLYQWFTEQAWPVLECAPAPITGADGNQEFVLKAQKS